MPLQLQSEEVWAAITKELFAVVGMVTAKNAARTVGVMYSVSGGKLFFGTGRDTWKVRHITANPHVSLTIPIAKRIALMPWVKIPAATITFAATARVLPEAEMTPDLLQATFRDLAQDKEFMAGNCLVEVTPVGEFITYGVGVPLMQMRYPEKARGRAPINGAIDKDR
jgi:hypothetical protein